MERLRFKAELEGQDLAELRKLTADGVPNRMICRRLHATWAAVAAGQKLLGIYRRRWTEFPELDEAEIRARCEEIQREWTAEVRERRRVGGPGEWSPAAVPVSVRRLILS